MGLTHNSTGVHVLPMQLEDLHQNGNEKVIALAGNPNVGKSTVFNALTGMNQHTGNWPGKTVTNARGEYTYQGQTFILVDIPGTYSLIANSAEEEIARDFICFGGADSVVVVADATCLERNLNLVLQIVEVTPNVILCVNLLDEAKKKHIQVDLKQLSSELGIPVVGTSARSKKGLDQLIKTIYEVSETSQEVKFQLDYGQELEQAVAVLEPTVKMVLKEEVNSRWLSLRLIDLDESMKRSVEDYLHFSPEEQKQIDEKRQKALDILASAQIAPDQTRDLIVKHIVTRSEEIYQRCVVTEEEKYLERDRKIDRFLTSKATGIPVMILLLALIFWITIAGANYPSQLLSDGLFWIEDQLYAFANYLQAPGWAQGLFISGMYRTLAWVVSVMLPPMAIFFPLFTLLEDSGYLPRIAFNMDKYFKKACAHGKQSLTMCMGFGCNACGVVGCRIIDSPRERLIAILTNNFVPCNGRFPTLIAIITMFFAGTLAAPYQPILSTLMLTGIILLGIIATLLVSRLLSKTILKGIPSSFALELPPYRAPQVGKVIVRSIFDRTLFVLGRAVTVAVPAGIIIWLMANLMIGDTSLLMHCTNFLDPFASLFGMDGVIIMAFLLGFPANEIVFPIIIMSYLCTGSMVDMGNLDTLRALLVDHGWTWVTATCVMLFSLMHFPCATTCLTIKKETKSWKWTAISFLLPTAIGLATCFVVANFARIFQFI